MVEPLPHLIDLLILLEAKELEGGTRMANNLIRYCRSAGPIRIRKQDSRKLQLVPKAPTGPLAK